MRTWYTGKPCERTKQSHINVAVYDSTWEASDAYILDNSDEVKAWVKNDHLGFEIFYIYRGVVRKYRPDFLVKLANDEMLILKLKARKLNRIKLNSATWMNGCKQLMHMVALVSGDRRSQRRRGILRIF